MYEKIIIALLLSGRSKHLKHMFSAPVAIVIILGVLAGVIGTILLFAYVIGKLTQKRSLHVQSTFSHDPDAPLSSVETGNPEI
uniref:Glycophorin-A n=1 Tax=Myotis myotis TaxID=51298 RepID=A0A7J7XG26_MYOMY|nr:glycophorin A (MNS blood group) [Myotis myotis]